MFNPFREYYQLDEALWIRQHTATCLMGNNFERHHRMPRFLGGTDSVENLIWVTQDEHAYLHFLIYMCCLYVYEEEDSEKNWDRLNKARGGFLRFSYIDPGFWSDV